MTKLTKPQRRALEAFRDVRGDVYVDHGTGKTVTWLVQHGYLENNFPGAKEAYRITEAGRQALEGSTNG